MRIWLRKHVGIWGWWHGENLGDQWIKRTMATLFPKAKFIRSDVTDLWGFNFVIIGGGGLFIFDVAPPFDETEGLPPFGTLGLGAEFPHPSGKALALKEKARFFYVRDRYSLDCMHITDTAQSYDITFAMPLRWEEERPDPSKMLFVWRDGREWLDYDLFREYLHFADNRATWEDICTAHFDDIRADDFQTRDDDIGARMQGVGFVVSGRYHGIVAAIQKGIPFIAIDICPKLRALCEEAGLSRYCVKQDETEQLGALIEEAKKNADEIRALEKAYRDRACTVIKEHVATAQKEIAKALRPGKSS